MTARTRMFAIDNVEDLLFANQELRELASRKGFSNQSITRSTLALCELGKQANSCAEGPLIISMLVNDDIRVEIEWSGPALVLHGCFMIDSIHHTTVDLIARRRRLMIREPKTTVA